MKSPPHVWYKAQLSYFRYNNMIFVMVFTLSNPRGDSHFLEKQQASERMGLSLFHMQDECVFNKTAFLLLISYCSFFVLWPDSPCEA
ncbi:MAG: hypothetical protein ABIK28_21980, partial [Planctomycetota bacterium]